LHIAPETGLFQLFSRVFSDYTGADFNTEPYAKWRPLVKFVDLCDIENSINRKYDLIFHNHVLEHIPCSPSVALAKLKSQLKPGGIMFFSIPVRNGCITTEDLDPQLSNEERTKLFGQWDHLRMFGEKDLFEILDPNNDIGVKLINYRDYLSEHCLRMHNLSPDICSQLSNSIFMVRSNSYD
jgi:SAM-dependent methyltransferase